MTDFPRVGDVVELRGCAAVPAGVVTAVHASASAGWLCRVRPLFVPCAAGDAAAAVAACHGAPVPRSARKPYFGDAELVLAHTAVDVPAAAVGPAPAVVERHAAFCARHVFPPGVWYCREAQDARDPHASAPLAFAAPDETVAAAALRTAVDPATAAAPSPRRVLRRLEAAAGDDSSSNMLSPTPTPSLSLAEDAAPGASAADVGTRSLRVVSTSDLDAADAEPATPLGTQQPPEPGATVDAAPAAAAAAPTAAELLFNEHSTDGVPKPTAGAAILVEASVSDLGEMAERTAAEAPATPPRAPRETHTATPPAPGCRQQQQQQQGGMMSFLRSSAKNMRRGTLMGWLQESPTKKASPVSQKPRLQLYSPTQEGRKPGSPARRQLPLRLFLSREDKEALDRHSTHPFPRTNAAPQAAAETSEAKNTSPPALAPAATASAGTKRGPQTLRDQFAQELKRCKRVELERKRARAPRADAPDSDDERFVVSDGHESSDSGEGSGDDDDDEGEGTKPKASEHGAAAGQPAPQPPPTTLWSFTLRQSFGVYLQMLVSACIDSEFLSSLHSDSANEASQYFLQAAFHVERQLLSRRDGIASSNVWEKSFHVCPIS